MHSGMQAEQFTLISTVGGSYAAADEPEICQ